MHVAAASLLMKLRRIGLLSGYDDDSTCKIGKQMTKNWSGSVLAEVKVPWTSEVLSKFILRTMPKATFYPHDFNAFNTISFYLHNALFYLCSVLLWFFQIFLPETLINIVIVNFNSMNIFLLINK